MGLRVTTRFTMVAKYDRVSKDITIGSAMTRLVHVSPHVVFSAEVLAATWYEVVTGVPLQPADANLETIETDSADVQLKLL